MPAPRRPSPGKPECSSGAANPGCRRLSAGEPPERRLQAKLPAPQRCLLHLELDGVSRKLTGDHILDDDLEHVGAIWERHFRTGIRRRTLDGSLEDLYGRRRWHKSRVGHRLDDDARVHFDPMVSTGGERNEVYTRVV